MIHSGISKSSNAGTLIRSACAFGAESVLIVGNPKTLQTFGSHGSDRFMDIKFFDTLAEVRDYCHKALKADVVGVEIRDDAHSVLAKDCFQKDCAFLMGNEGDGISQEQARFV